MVASLEKASEHPLAEAIVSGANERKIPLPKTLNFNSLTRMGVKGQINEKDVLVGDQRLFEKFGVDFKPLSKMSNELQNSGNGSILVAVGGLPAGVIAVKDPIKASSKPAVEYFHSKKIAAVILTGDNKITADAAAREIGINEVEANVIPETKNVVINNLRAKGRVVAMAGDGINDAPALAQADIGTAMGTRTDVAIQSAEIMLVRGDLTGIVRAHQLSQHTMKNIRQNLLFAFGYNALGIPIAAGLLYPHFGILLSPMLASLPTSLSSVSVIGNALRLRRFVL